MLLKIGCGLQRNIVYIFLYLNSLHFASLISLVLVYKNLYPLRDDCVYVGIFYFYNQSFL